MDRDLDWAACGNVRDLGGLPAADGGRIRRGALVRADSLARLDADGWAALEAHGVRTVIDLRNDDEVGDDDAPRPASITTVRFPLDGMEDTAFWDQWMHRPEFGTPHYYGPWLERFPDRAGRVLEAIARAEPGGVAYHCVGGRDRTGLVTMLLLAFAGVPAELAAADYALSLEHVPDALLAAFYAEQGTTPAGVFAEVVAGVDAAQYLGAEDRAALHPRSVESVPAVRLRCAILARALLLAALTAGSSPRRPADAAITLTQTDDAVVVVGDAAPNGSRSRTAARPAATTTPSSSTRRTTS